MPKLEQEPRLRSVGADVIEWARRVVGAVNPLIDAADGPAFIAYLSINAGGAPTGVLTPLTALSELNDTSNCYDTSTGKFTPTVAGFYQVSGSVYLTDPAGNITNAQAHILKNGFNGKVLAVDTGGAFAQPTWQRSGSSLIFMNGTTDYLQLAYFASISAGSLTIVGSVDASATGWTAHLARRA